jgi:hypothetical protein
MDEKCEVIYMVGQFCLVTVLKGSPSTNGCAVALTALGNRGRMVVGFAISAYQHSNCKFEPRFADGEVYSIHYYAIQFISDLRLAFSGFFYQ